MLGAALAACVLAAVALGQDVGVPERMVTVNVTPSKAGTPSRPQGVLVKAKGVVNAPTDTVARSFDVWLPKGWVYNGAEHPVCKLATLTTGGPSACPPGSIMGGGPEGAHVDVADDLSPPPRVKIINGGPTKMYFWTVISLPARVQAPVLGRLTKLTSSRWSYRLHADIPGSLQVIAGIPITLDSFHIRAGRGDWIATTSCPRDRLWRYRLQITSTDNQLLTTDGSIPCRS